MINGTYYAEKLRRLRQEIMKKNTVDSRYLELQGTL